MSELIVKGGHVFDPASGKEAKLDIRIVDGLITEVAPEIERKGAGEVLDASGLWVFPGLIDMHVHLRQPGGEDEETTASGLSAALGGGFSAVLAMPNTEPPLDSPELVSFVLDEARRARAADLLVAGALTEGRRGERPADLPGLVRAGASAFADDGAEPGSARVMRAAMELAASVGKPVLVHAEDGDLARGGVMNEGALSSRLGLAGRPALAEELAVMRDVRIAREAGCRLHVQHVSSARGLAEVRAAKASGLPVTCEVTPHHLLLTEESCAGYDPAFKVFPPLRTEADRLALVEGLKGGSIDAVATDHAPHAAAEKGIEFELASPGAVGLETALGLVLTELVRPGIVTPMKAAYLLSAGPAMILGLEYMGRISPGARGNLTVIDPEAEWTVEPESFRSKSRNTPFAGRRLVGRAVFTIVRGEVVFRL